MKDVTAGADLAGLTWRNPAPNAAPPAVPTGAFRSFTLSHGDLEVDAADYQRDIRSLETRDLITDLEGMVRWIGGEDGWGNHDWRAGPKGLDGKAYAADMRSAIDVIQRQQAEIAELRGMIDEALGPVKLVSELATMTDIECEFMDWAEVREIARGKLNGDFALPRIYGEEDRARAADVISRYGAGYGGKAHLANWVDAARNAIVDDVAAALGMRKAS